METDLATCQRNSTSQLQAINTKNEELTAIISSKDDQLRNLAEKCNHQDDVIGKMEDKLGLQRSGGRGKNGAGQRGGGGGGSFTGNKSSGGSYGRQTQHSIPNSIDRFSGKSANCPFQHSAQPSYTSGPNPFQTAQHSSSRPDTAGSFGSVTGTPRLRSELTPSSVEYAFAGTRKRTRTPTGYDGGHQKQRGMSPGGLGW